MVPVRRERKGRIMILRDELQAQVDATVRLVRLLDRAADGAFDGDPVDWEDEDRELAVGYDPAFPDRKDRDVFDLFDEMVLEAYQVVHRRADGGSFVERTVVVFTTGGPHVEALVDSSGGLVVGRWGSEEVLWLVDAPGFAAVVEDMF